MITTIHPPYDGRIYVRELMALVEAGYSLAMVAPWEKTERADPRVLWVPTGTPTRRLDRILHGWRTFRAALRIRAKAFHFHDVDFLPWALALKLFKRVPVVYDCHENYPEEILYNKPWIAKPLRAPLAFALRIFEDFSVRMLGQVIVPVPSIEEKFGRFRHVHMAQVRNLARWRANRELPHERALICTGSLSWSYGVDGLLEIGRELKRRGKDYPLILTERFPSPGARESFVKAVAEEGLAIRIQPKVAPGDMDKLLSQAWISLATELDTPDRSLSLPTKLFEYMAMGLPVVASNIPLSREVVESAECGLVVPAGDWKAFVDAIIRLWEDEALRERCREKGFAAIEGEFNWDLEQKKIQRFFAEAIGAPSIPSGSPEQTPRIFAAKMDV